MTILQTFTGRNGSLGADPLYGFTGLKQLYLKADPEYTGRYLVPCLWDKKTETIVNNESSEIIRMFFSAFDDFLDPPLREVNKPNGGFYPPSLRSEIDAMNQWVYNDINNGVYKCGFAATQEAYDAAVYPLFKSLDRLEEHLSNPQHQPYLFGSNITEADIRLYTTMIRFDVAYHCIFQCNIKMIRHDYPLLSRWLRNLYWDTSDRTNGGVFKNTTFFDVYKYGYLRAKGRQTHGGTDHGWAVILPRGPAPDILPLTDEEEQLLISGKLSGLHVDTNGSKAKSSQNPFSANGQGMAAMFSAEGADAQTPATAETPIVKTTSAALREQDDEKDDIDPQRKIQRRTTHGEENAKWVKAAKKAEKKSGAPNMHLAL